MPDNRPLPKASRKPPPPDLLAVIHRASNLHLRPVFPTAAQAPGSPCGHWPALKTARCLIVWLYTAWAAGANSAHAEAPEAAALRSEACPERFVTPRPESLNDYLKRLGRLADACEYRADYFALRGSLQLKAGRVQEAATSLEKALLLDPDLPGAQIDYAQALALLGQKGAAVELVSQVSQHSDIAPGLRQWLQDLEPPAAAAPGAWRWGALAHASAGHETNLNSVTHIGSLTLYLSNGPVQVELADTEQPSAGQGLRTALAVQGVRPLGPGEWRVGLAGQQRRAPGVDGADNHLIDALSSYTLALGPGLLSLRLNAVRYRRSAPFDFDEQGLTAKYEYARPLLGCRWALAAQQAQQTYPGNAVLSGDYTNTRFEARCEQTAGAHLGLQISHGRNTPHDPDRPGGNKDLRWLALRQELALPLAGANGQLSLSWRYYRTQDETALSPLLGGMRTLARRQDLGLGYWWRLSGRWHAGIELEWMRQTANYELANLRNRALYTGLRWTSD